MHCAQEDFRSNETTAKRVQYNTISHHATPTIKSAIELLHGVGLVYKVYFTSGMNSPLSSGKNPRDFRLYLCDTGLFHALVGTALPPLLNDRIYYANDGILGEYFLNLSLIAATPPSQKHHEVYFWENKKSPAGAEIDGVFFHQQTLCVFDAKRKRQRVSHSLRSYAERFFFAASPPRPALLAATVSTEEIKRPAEHQLFVNIPYYLLTFIFGTSS